MEKWEYKVAYIARRFQNDDKIVDGEIVCYWQEDIEEELNELGQKGWEIVTFPTELFEHGGDGYALFKRRVTE